MGMIPETWYRGEKTKLRIDSLSRQDADHVYNPHHTTLHIVYVSRYGNAPKGSGTPKLLREVREGNVAWVSEGVTLV